MRISSRLFQAGLGLLTIGAGGVVGCWVYALDKDVTFWNWLGIGSVAASLFGLAITTLGLVGSRESTDTQSLRAGDNSINLQAGRDVDYRSNGPSDV